MTVWFVSFSFFARVCLSVRNIPPNRVSPKQTNPKPIPLQTSVVSTAPLPPLSVWLSLCSLPLSPLTPLSVCLCVSPSVSLSVCLSVCLPLARQANERNTPDKPQCPNAPMKRQQVDTLTQLIHNIARRIQRQPAVPSLGIPVPPQLRQRGRRGQREGPRTGGCWTT